MTPPLMSRHTAITFLSAVFLLPLISFSQTAPAAPPETDDEIVYMSPFEVQTSKDYGYTTANSLAGGRLDTELMKTPVSINVLNREFLDDLGVSDVQEALAWSVGSIAASSSDVNENAASGDSLNGRPATAGNNNVLSLRGFSSITVARNYFQWFVNSDGYNTERLDISRGPNALIFGDANTGGIVNVTTKRAYFKPKYTATMQVSDQGQLRGSVDVNQPMGKIAAIRVNGLIERSDGWRDYYENDRDGVALAITVHPWKGAQIRFDGEYGKTSRMASALYIRDVASRWDGATVYSQRFTGTSNAAARTGTSRFDNTATTRNKPYMILNLGDIESGFVDWQGWSRTAGEGTPLETGLPGIATTLGLGAIPIDQRAALGTRGYRIVPDYAYAPKSSAYRVDEEYYAGALFFEQRILKDLFFEVAGVMQYRDNANYTPASHNQLFIDVNKTRPDGSANPYYLEPYIGGSGMRPIVTDQHVHEIRASLVYNLKLPFTKQRLGLVGSQRFSETDMRQKWFQRVNGSVANVADMANRLYFQEYLSERGGYVPWEDGDTVTFSDGTVAEYVASTLGGNSFTKQTVSTIQGFASGSWFAGDRLSTVFGIRSDKVKIKNYSPKYNATTGRLEEFVYAETVTTDVNSPSAGVVYEIFPWLSPYVNYSKTFTPAQSGNGTYDIFMSVLPTKRGEGWDFGIKYSIWDGRIVGSVGYYTTEEQNNTIIDGTLADAVNRNATFLGATSDIVQRAYSDTQDVKATGFELDLTANLTRNWSLMLNGSIPDSEVSNALPRYHRIVSENLDAWTAAANNPANPNASDIKDNLAIIDQQFALRANGMPIIGSTDYIAKVFTRYRISKGTLKGLFFGGGATFEGRRLRAQFEESPAIYSKGYTTLSALVGYGCVIKGLNLRAQINVSNLLDEEQFRYTSYTLNTSTGEPMARQFRVATPRTITMSVTLSF